MNAPYFTPGDAPVLFNTWYPIGAGIAVGAGDGVGAGVGVRVDLIGGTGVGVGVGLGAGTEIRDGADVVPHYWPY